MSFHSTRTLFASLMQPGRNKPPPIHLGALPTMALRSLKLSVSLPPKRTLGQIANFCPVISRNSIVKHSTSLNDIWQKIRQHYGFQSSGAHFLDLASIRLQPDERPEDLFQRLMAFFEDNLLSVHGALTHHGDQVTTEEDLSPTMENTVVFLWLQLIHPGLPLLVKQKIRF